MFRIACLFLLSVTLSCAAGPGGGDAGEIEDVVDASVVADAGDGANAIDAGDPVDAGGSVDGGNAGNSGIPGQCRSDSDCPTNDCTEGAPGGFCAACGSDDDCPAGHECNDFGTCNRSCSADSECPTGLRCLTSQGLCVLKTCGSCPVGTVCEGGFCRRPTCSEACSRCEDGYCVE